MRKGSPFLVGPFFISARLFYLRMVCPTIATKQGVELIAAI